jgi:hypothetical protein
MTILSICSFLLFFLIQWSSLRGFSVSTTSSTTTSATISSVITTHYDDDISCNNNVMKPMGSAIIDYSTATEFIEEHYNIPLYFGEQIRRKEWIYDGRKGIIVDHKNMYGSSVKLDECGFQLFKAPTQVSNFEDMHQVQKYYINELEKLIPKALGVTEEDIEKLVLWHPTLRGEEISVGPRLDDRPGLGPIAGKAHIDTDVGAYGLDGVCSLVNNNRVDATTKSLGKDESIKDDLMKACEDGRRMILLNLWRPLVPVSSAPLGLLAIQYDTSSFKPEQAVFPKVSPSPEMSHWYIFSNMQPDECLIFKQYDRRLDKMSDIWHCALKIQEESLGASKPHVPRSSFDIKAMVVLKEQVPPHLDRFEATTRPILTWEESGEVCNAQAQRLKEEQEIETSS